MNISISLYWSNFSDLSPEVMGVTLYSVVAMIFKRNNRGKQLALRAAQRGLAHHQCAI